MGVQRGYEAFWKWDIYQETGPGFILDPLAPKACNPSSDLWNTCGDFLMTLHSTSVFSGWELYRLLLLIPQVIMNDCQVLGTTLPPSFFLEQGNCRALGAAWGLPAIHSFNARDTLMVRNLWDHKLTLRVDGIGLTLEPTNGLVVARDEWDSVRLPGQLPKVWQHHWGPTWSFMPNACVRFCHPFSLDAFGKGKSAFSWESVPSKPRVSPGLFCSVIRALTYAPMGPEFHCSSRACTWVAVLIPCFGQCAWGGQPMDVSLSH